MTEIPEAGETTLRKLKQLAPPYHQHIVRKKLFGITCGVDDFVVVYEVIDIIST